jgi:hypothetical protein
MQGGDHDNDIGEIIACGGEGWRREGIAHGKGSRRRGKLVGSSQPASRVARSVGPGDGPTNPSSKVIYSIYIV